jgi:hypothetical protein
MKNIENQSDGYEMWQLSDSRYEINDAINSNSAIYMLSSLFVDRRAW